MSIIVWKRTKNEWFWTLAAVTLDSACNKRATTNSFFKCVGHHMHCLNSRLNNA